MKVFYYLYEAGFNPRFSEDGNDYHGHDKSIIHKLIEFCYSLFLEISANWHIYTTSDIEERNLLRLIWKCIKTEAKLADLEEQRCVKNQSDVAIETNIMLHRFFEQSNELFHCVRKRAKEDGSLPVRCFPSELLKCIAIMNHPQARIFESKQLAYHPTKRPNSHTDLTRMSVWGFLRLQQKGDVNPWDFIVAIDKPSENLKLHIRQWRSFLIQSKEDFFDSQKISSLQGVAASQLEDLSTSWKTFVKSHEVLEEVQSVLEEEDFYQEYYPRNDDFKTPWHESANRIAQALKEKYPAHYPADL